MMLREPTEEELAELQAHLRLLTWVYARQSAGLGDTEPYLAALNRADADRTKDQAFVTDNAAADRARRKDLHLQWLRMLRHVEKQLPVAADWLATLAANQGANYRELGDAWGISRQGALKKWAGVVDDSAAPDVGDRVRLTYGDGSICEGTWEITDDGPALRLDDGILHDHVTGQVRREVIDRAH